MDSVRDIERRLKEEAARLLTGGEVSVVLAYGKGYDEKHPMPFAVHSASDTDSIVFNEYCSHNLARYLKDYPAGTRIAIAVKGCDSRAVVVLIQEGKVKREDLVILGIACRGMKDARTGKEMDAATTCNTLNPVLYDVLLGEPLQPESQESPYDVLVETEAMEADSRWEFWKVELGRCIRCYACRKACPMCYCDPCFVDQSRPQWADKSPDFQGNIMYHLTRFYHLAGRCIDCGECSRACPIDIPLYLFHKKIARDCEELFGQKAGMNMEDKPVMVDFRVEDSDDILG